MERNRLILFFAIALPIYVAGMVWMNHNQRLRRQQMAEYQALVEAQQAQEAGGVTGDGATTATATATATPGAPTGNGSAAVPQAAPIPATREQVEPVVVTTKSYEIAFSPAGGVPVSWEITDPAVTHALDPDMVGVTDDEPGTSSRVLPKVQLIDPELEATGQDRPLEIVLKEQNARYYNEFNSFVYEVETEETEDATVVRFTSPVNEQGLQLIKTYRVPDRDFLTELTLEFINRGGSRLTFNNQGQGLGLALGPGLGLPPSSEGTGFGLGQYAFTQPIYNDNGEIEVLKVGDPTDPPETFVSPNADVPYAGLHTRYFLIAAVTDPTSATGQGFTSGKARLDGDLVSSGVVSGDDVVFYPRFEVYTNEFAIDPGQSREFSYTLFGGPKDREILTATNLGLEEMLFHDSWRWMRILCLGLMYLLGIFHGFFGNWGVAIIVLVVTVRLVTLPLTQIQLRHQATMQAEMGKVKPYIDKINEKYKDNPTKRNQEMMKLYREHNINPLGMFRGCMWMVIQLPIFFALYRLLGQSFDLRGADFLWIEDLSQPDHLLHLGFSLPLFGEYFNLLPVLTAGTQMFVSRLMMRTQTMTADPTQAAMQKQMMYMMPVFILFMTYSFPSGLVLYWFVSNVWQLFQQQFVQKRILGKPAEAAAAAT